MDSSGGLLQSLKGLFKWNKARLFCLAGILLALITVRTVNLREIAVAFSGEALLDSRYKRLCRFFAYFKKACRDARYRLLPSLSIIDSQYATT